MVEQLTNQEWREFFLDELGVIKSGKDINQNDMIKGDVPYISATSFNNGINNFIDNNNNTLESDCISINRTGSVGYAFYHPYSALFSNNCRKFILNENKDKHISLFIVNQIKQQKEKYSYGYIMGTERIKRQKIMLPITKEGEPDYKFMSQFMKNIEKQQIEKYKRYIDQRKSQLKYKEIESLNNKEWGEFYIKDLFNILPGKRLTKNNMIEGETPFIGSTSLNNGITNYVSNENESLDCNVLGVNYNGSVVENFYHPYHCIFSDDVKRFHLKEYEDNKHILLFFKSIILQQKVKYMYGYKFNSERMNEQVILVPINEFKLPDYEYMEQYMINLEIKLLTKYLDFLAVK